MSTIDTMQIDGELSVGGNVAAGGDANIQGNVRIGHNLKVEGWLDARNIKGTNKGMFSSVDALKSSYPTPRNGWYALVGTELPAPVYVVKDGKWVASGGKGGNPSCDVNNALEVIEEIRRNYSFVHDLGDMGTVAAAMEAAASYDIVRRQDIRMIIWTHGNDSGIIYQTHLGMERARQFMFFDSSPVRCKYRSIYIDIHNGNAVSVGAWQELMMPVGFSYDRSKGSIRALGVASNSDEAQVSWPVATLPLCDLHAPGLMSPSDKRKLDGMEDKIPVPQDTRSATAGDNCFVYATDDPQSKSSVLNAPDTKIRQANGKLKFQKGMWNPNGETIYYTQDEIPAATPTSDGVMSAADKANLSSIADLGILSQADAENRAAERAITESDVRMINWRTGNGGSGDGCSILQSRWGTHYVCQVELFVGQKRECRFRFITTGGNYSVGEWQEIIMATGFEYDERLRMVRSIGIRPQDKKDLFRLPLGNSSRAGLLRIGKGLEINVSSGTAFISPRTKSGIGVDSHQIFAVLGAGMKFDENGGISVDVEALKALLGLNTAAEGA